MVKLIALLGNKGTLYGRTRHNSGWLFGDALSAHVGAIPSWQEKFHGVWANLPIADTSVVLLKPLTYMNESGTSIGEACRYFHFAAEDVLVVHDDIETQFGTVKLQKGGGLGGHNGLRSTNQALGCDQFLRLRIGIGRPLHGDVASFVLGHFTPEESIQLPLILDMAVGLTESFIKERCAMETLPRQGKLPL
ncbi:MAG: aminoacyl-tRNA hydrolase [Sphaerochaetaceae bacterium]